MRYAEIFISNNAISITLNTLIHLLFIKWWGKVLFKKPIPRGWVFWWILFHKLNLNYR